MTEQKNVKIKEPLAHLSKRDSISFGKNFWIRALAIFFAFLVSSVFLVIYNGVTPFEMIGGMFSGNFGNGAKWLEFLRNTAILLLISVAVTPAFKMKFWNIGAEGQVLIGALASVAVNRSLSGHAPEAVVLILMFVACMFASIAWAVLPAIFKAIWNTNETLFTLMMNYIATQLVLFSIKFWEPKSTGTLTYTGTARLPALFGGDYWLSIIVAVIMAVAIFVYLKYFKHGYEVAVVGESESTAKYIGIDVKKIIIRSLILSGAICGVVGYLLSASINHTVSSSSVGGQGFTAILVSWLAKFNPLVMILVSAFVIFITKGSKTIMEIGGVTNDYFSGFFVGLVFFFIIGCEFFINYKLTFRQGSWLDKVFTPVGKFFDFIGSKISAFFTLVKDKTLTLLFKKKAVATAQNTENEEDKG